MKKNIMLFIVATSIAFTACKKNNNNSPIPDNKQLLSKVTETSATDTTVTNLTYDNNKRLSLIKTSEGDETRFTYNGNDLVGIESKSEDDKTTLQVTYANGKPASGVYSIYEDNALTEKFNISYTLTGDAVTEIVFKDSTNTEIYKNVITYQNNNISKVETFAGNNSLGKQEYTYGSKKSMFYNSRVKYVVDLLTVSLYSANEALTEKSALLERTNAYTYDSNGYPVAADVTEKMGGTTSTSKLKLEY